MTHRYIAQQEAASNSTCAVYWMQPHKHKQIMCFLTLLNYSIIQHFNFISISLSLYISFLQANTLSVSASTMCAIQSNANSCMPSAPLACSGSPPRWSKHLPSIYIYIYIILYICLAQYNVDTHMAAIHKYLQMKGDSRLWGGRRKRPQGSGSNSCCQTIHACKVMKEVTAMVSFNWIW